MLAAVEQRRLKVSGTITTQRKSQFGQFFTPASIARFMVDMFENGQGTTCHLLDAGAGIGSLSAAFFDRWVSGRLDFECVKLDAFEIDKNLHTHLIQTLYTYEKQPGVTTNIHEDDFIAAAVRSLLGDLFTKTLPRYTHAILNPPYKKIRSDSVHRALLRSVGIETVNLYSAFVALSVSLLEKGGQLVAIIPRSFCNGPYYRPFREYILEHAAIRHIHLFTSRNTAFKDDDVLQENLIIMMERNAHQDNVTITTSTDDSFADLTTHIHLFDRIVFPDDSERFIHIPTSSKPDIIEQLTAVRYSLDELGITVSTGPVVDFRLKKHLRDMPETGTVPLLYPAHFNTHDTVWPRPGHKKANAIEQNNETMKWLYPNGYYCVVKRFSSKEEKRRIAAHVVQPESFPNSNALGFENHLNVFHEGRKGLPEALAYGLNVFLNTQAVDEYFRRFNGHTQVNATDLRRMKYPDRATLMKLGEWAMNNVGFSQQQIDSTVMRMCRS